MKVCILSDSHDHIPLLDRAVSDAIELGVEAVLHCGDVVAPSTLHCLRKYDIPVHVIHGNNTGDLYSLTALSHKDANQIKYYGMDAGFSLGGKRIFLVHYPHYARAMAATGNYDLVCCGHSHKVSIEVLENVKHTHTTVVNPGTIGGVGKDTANWVLGDLSDMTFDVHEVSKSIEFDDE